MRSCHCSLLVCVFFMFAEISMGWYSFYGFKQTIAKASGEEGCNNSSAYWAVFLVFQTCATSTAMLQFFWMFKKSREKIHKARNGHLGYVVFSFLFSSGVSLTYIFFLSTCKCLGTNLGDHISELFRGISAGVSRVIIQVLIHVAEVILLCKKTEDTIEDAERTHGCVKFLNVLIFLITLAIFGTEIRFLVCS